MKKYIIVHHIHVEFQDYSLQWNVINLLQTPQRCGKSLSNIQKLEIHYLLVLLPLVMLVYKIKPVCLSELGNFLFGDALFVTSMPSDDLELLTDA